MAEKSRQPIVRDESPLEKMIRLARTRWYIDYRRWDMVCVNLMKARYGMEGPMDEQALPEDYLQLMRLKLPIDILAKQIENYYASDSQFDRSFYYHPEAWFGADQVIDPAGVQAIENELRRLCDQYEFTVSELQKYASLPVNALTECLPVGEFEHLGIRVLLPELPNSQDLWEHLRYRNVELPEAYLFFGRTE